MQECMICFVDFPLNRFVKCFLPNCKSEICYHCTKTNLEICKNENRIPKCFYCMNYMLHKMLENFQDLILEYNKCCINQMTKEKAYELTEDISIDNNIEKIREIRKLFIESKFPLAIAYVAKNFLGHKLKKVDKKEFKNEKVDFMEEGSINSIVKKIKCMNLMCKGYLDCDYKCMICDTEFCKDCEAILSENHECKKEDLETMNLINEFIKCPKCLLPVEKSSGCDSMKCSSCGENFYYSTGKSGGAGNSHNSKIFMRENVSITSEYYKYLNKMNLISEINTLENNKPKDNEKALDNSIKKYLKNNINKEYDDTILENNVSREFQKYIINNIKIKNYNKLMITIEQEIKSETLDLDKLNEILIHYEKLNLFNCS